MSTPFRFTAKDSARSPFALLDEDTESMLTPVTVLKAARPTFVDAAAANADAKLAGNAAITGAGFSFAVAAANDTAAEKDQSATAADAMPLAVASPIATCAEPAGDERAPTVSNATAVAGGHRAAASRRTTSTGHMVSEVGSSSPENRGQGTYCNGTPLSNFSFTMAHNDAANEAISNEASAFAALLAGDHKACDPAAVVPKDAAAEEPATEAVVDGAAQKEEQNAAGGDDQLQAVAFDATVPAVVSPADAIVAEQPQPVSSEKEEQKEEEVHSPVARTSPAAAGRAETTPPAAERDDSVPAPSPFEFQEFSPEAGRQQQQEDAAAAMSTSPVSAFSLADKEVRGACNAALFDCIGTLS